MGAPSNGGLLEMTVPRGKIDKKAPDVGHGASWSVSLVKTGSFEKAIPLRPI